VKLLKLLKLLKLFNPLNLLNLLKLFPLSLHATRYALYAVLLLLAGCASPMPFDFSKLVWPLPPEEPRFRYVSIWLNEDSFTGTGPTWVEKFFGEETKKEGLVQPHGVVADRNGNIYVADTFGKGVVVFDMEKRRIRHIGFTSGALSKAIGVAIDAEREELWASDMAGNVYKYNKKGEVLLALGRGQKGQLKNPTGLAFDRKNNRLFIVDTKQHKIFVFNRDGNPIASFGKPGKGDGELAYPVALAVDDDGRIYVSDSGNFRVQIFDSDFRFLKKFGVIGTAYGELGHPKGIAVDSEKNIYVVDAAANAIKIFNNEGQLLLVLGDTGIEPGQFWLPVCIYMDEEDRLYTTETLNRRVQVFQYMSEKYKKKQAEQPAQPKK